MRTTGKRASGRAPRALITTLALALLATLLLAGPALAAGHEGPGKSVAKPGRPTATRPSGLIGTATPTFRWSRARGATRYEVRVFEGGALLTARTGLRSRSWTSRLALPPNVDLTWKVRGRNAGGAGPWSRTLTFRIVPSISDKAITSFSFQGLAPPVTGVIDEAARTIALAVPTGTVVTALVASFTTTGASVAIAGTPQESGATANDFTNPVTYTVTAADASTQDYVVTVTVGGLAIGDPYQGGIVAYILQPGDPGYVAGETRGLIAAAADQNGGATIIWALPAHQFISVPGGTGTAIGTGSANTDAIIAQNGAGGTYAAGLARAYTGGGYTDWYLPSKDELNQLYLNQVAIGGFESTLYWSSSEYDAYDAWYQYLFNGDQYYPSKFSTYRVRAIRAFPPGPVSSAKALTAFSFQGLAPPVVGVIDEAAHTIALAVPAGADRTGLVATFSTTGASVSVAGAPQVSGLTINDFTNPVTYTVTAADASTQDYTVTVTVAPGLAIGDAYQGGIVAYILQPGDPGYVAGATHGLIAAAADQSTGIAWSNVTDALIGPAASGTGIGTGQGNTTAIVSQAGCTSGAAYLCDTLVEGGYSDWYLPSSYELYILIRNGYAIGGFGTFAYWSSTEYGVDTAESRLFDTGDGGYSWKGVTGHHVRAIRAF